MERKRILEMISNITEYMDDSEGAKIMHPF